MHVTWADGIVHLRLWAEGRLVLDGVWELQVAVDGVDVPLRGAWESVLWNSEKEADYLELELFVDDRVRINRQILLPRAGQLAVFADAVIAPAGTHIAYRSRVAPANGLVGAASAATRECRLRGPGTARLYPLALECDRSANSSGTLSIDGAVELTQQQPGKALYAPLMIDWSRRRRGARAWWRRLTVSEQGVSIPPDVAAGYRLQVGREQWLAYRSLQSTGEARAVLGHHSFYETVIGRFLPNGSVDSLIQVE
jgi:hypothetical protein